MPDLTVQIKADLSNYIAGMKQAGSISASAASDITNQLARVSQAQTDLGGSTLSTSMKFQQMRSGMSAARDGMIGLTMSGQRADSALMAMGHHFTSLVSETGSITGAFQALGQSLLGAGGVILAITLAAELWRKYSESQSDAYDATKNFSNATAAQDSIFNNLDGSYKDTVKNVEELRTNVDLAKNGFISKNEVIKEYNDTMGKTAGLVKTLDGVEQSLVKNGAAYIQMMLYKAAAQTAMSQAADKAVEIAKKQAAPDDEALGYLLSGAKNVVNPDELKKLAQTRRDQASAEYKKDEDLLVAAATSLQAKAAAISKQMNFSFLPSEEKKSKEDVTGYDLLKQQITDATTALQDAVVNNKSEKQVNALAVALANLTEKLTAADLAIKNSQLMGKGAAPLTGVNSGIGSILPDTNPLFLGNKLNPTAFDKSQSTDIAPKDIEAQMDAAVKSFKEYNDMMQKGHALQQQKKIDDKEEQKNLQIVERLIGDGLVSAMDRSIQGGENFFSSMTKMLEQMVLKLAETAAAAEALSLILQFTGLGELLGITGAAASFSSIFGSMSGIKIPGHAAGGITLKPHMAMVGEGGESEVIAPLSKLKSYMQTNGGGQQVFIPRLEISGPKALVFFDRAQKQKSRIG